MRAQDSVRETLALRAIGRRILAVDDRLLRDATGTVVAEDRDQIAAVFARIATVAAANRIQPAAADRYVTWRGVKIAVDASEGVVLSLYVDHHHLDMPLPPQRVHHPAYLFHAVQREMDRAVRFLNPATATPVASRGPVDQLRQRWAFLSCHQVEEAAGRDPEDVSSIELQRSSGRRRADGTMIYVGRDPDAPTYRRVADIPAADRARARVLWRDYHGSTTDGVAFEQNTSTALDLTPTVTLDWSVSVNTALEVPRPGQWLYGEVEHTDTGRRMRHWSPCGTEFPLLLDLIRSDEPLRYSEDELGRLLLTDDYPDRLWAIARLVFFDNVQAFVDAEAIGLPGRTVPQLFMGEPRPTRRTPHESTRHPASGMAHGRQGEFSVSWEGMYLGLEPSQFVHEMSFLLDQPHWWQGFLELAAEQGVPHAHPPEGGVCEACISRDPHWHTNGFPYQRQRIRRL